MNVVGICEPFLNNFGQVNGVTARIFPEGQWWTFIYSTVLLIICTGVCLVGSAVFAKAGKILFVTLLFATFSVPLSVLFVRPFEDARFNGAAYTGFAWQTIKENLLPKFTKGAAGSMIKGKENLQDLFSVFFPATCGIFAGASMSGDLKKPNKSIPKGTLNGLKLTYVSYSIVILAMGSSISRELLYKNIQVLQDVSMNKYIILLGEFSTSLFSTLVGIVGSAKLLQALAKDEILPLTKPFAKGTPINDDPINAVIFTYVLTQITLLFDVNQIASFITMAFLMTFIVTNLACFLLKIASAPNFRPSFKYFNTYTAGAGAFTSVVAMFIADGLTASMMIIFLIVLFMLIHYISMPKPWGDVSQALIYHQVRKYLLRLRQDHVKFWRPQILLLVDDPRTAWNLIHFCNHLKKGGLYILGHVVVTEDFQQSFTEVKKQQAAWVKLRDVSKVKAFVQIACGPNVVWGARNVYMGSGLGGMRPNITVLGFFEKKNHLPSNEASPNTIPLDHIPISMEELPTDICRRETKINVSQWVNIVEDLLTMRANIAIAKGFSQLELPSENKKEGKDRKYIDLYPIQMSAQIIDENGETSALTTNFDTYTLILQMGAILRTVPDWKANHDLRVVVFVEFEEDVEEERHRIKILLERLRINAEILVLCLNGGQVQAYDTIIHDKPDKSGRVTKLLGKYEWWLELQDARKEWKQKYGDSKDAPSGLIPQDRVERILQAVDSYGIGSVSMGNQDGVNGGDTTRHNTMNSPPLNSFLKNRKRRHTMSSLQQMGVGMSFQTNRIRKSELNHATDYYRDSSESESEEDDDPSDSAIDSLSSSVNNVSEVVPIPSRQRTFPVTKKTKPASLPRETTLGSKPSSNGQSKLNESLNFSKKKISADSSASVSPEQSFLNKALKQGTPVSDAGLQTLKPSNSGASTPKLGVNSKKRKPNFSSLAMPNTKVDEADDGRPTIMFEDYRISAPPSKSPSVTSLIKSSITTGTSIAGLRPPPPASERTPLLARSTSADENGGFGSTQTSATSNAKTATPASKRPSVSWEVTEEVEEVEEDQNDGSGAYLSFNDLPATAQHVILNDLMRATSQDSAVIFSTLPAPALGTHLSEEESWQYVESLDIWCNDLPPVILLHSQTMTVTTAL